MVVYRSRMRWEEEYLKGCMIVGVRGNRIYCFDLEYGIGLGSSRR